MTRGLDNDLYSEQIAYNLYIDLYSVFNQA